MGGASGIDGRFDIVRLAGAGGMGRVYEATDRLTGNAVALKVLHDESATAGGRFAREIRLLSALRHPGVVRYVAHGFTREGQPYLAMEWLAGETLQARLERGNASVAESVALGLAAARALAAVHRAGVIHRDLKPSNVFLADGAIGRPVLIDFGVARAPDAGRRLTLTGAMVGTPGYMAPEQVRGDGRIDARADLFALGCVLFRCLTGRDVFTGDGSLSVMFKVVLEDPPRVASLCPNVPRALDELCAGMLAKERAARLPDAEAVVTVLEALEARISGARWSLAPPGLPAAQITGAERRLTCILMAHDLDAADDRAPQMLAEAVERHHGRVERLADGALVVMLGGAGPPTDLASRAARCAFAVRDALGGAPVSLAAGLCEVEPHLPVGDMIDRAVRLLAAAGERGAPSAIFLDEVMAGLLGERFDVRPAGEALALHGEHVELDVGRRLLGRTTLCLGRERELGLLEALFANAVEDVSANAALITGEAGVGKSRLRHELLRRLRARGERFEVWIGGGDSLSAGSAFAVLARAVRHAAGIYDGDAPEVRRDKIRRRVAALAAPAAAAVFLGELAGAPFPDDESLELRAARADPVLMGDQIRRAAEDLLRAACGRGPLVLVLEDLQWGNLPTMTFVHAALRNLADLPLLVLALARPEVEDLFPPPWDERWTQVVRLSPLPRRAAERLVRHALGDAAPADVVTALVERSGGNAFYLEELMRAVVSGEGPLPGGDPRAELPETVLAMVQARLEGIEPDLRRTLRAASVFGRTFSPGGVEALLGASARHRLAELVAAELVVRRAEAADGEPSQAADQDGGSSHAVTGDVEHAFRHALVRDAAYGMLTAEDRALGHRLAGAWLEREGKGDAMELAEHFERGGEPARAAAFYRRAAEEALAGNDLAAALARAERGAASGAAGEELGALRLVQAEAHNWRGELDRAGERAGEAVALLDEGSPAWFRAVMHAASAAGKQGEGDRIARLIESAFAATPAAGATSARALCLGGCAGELLLAGRPGLADGCLARLGAAGGDSLEIDPQALAVIHQARAFQAVGAGDLGAARACLEASIAASESAGDRRAWCNARGNLGFVLVELGGFAEAEAALRAAHAEAERLGLGEVAAHALQTLGYVLLHTGRLDEARSLEESALERLAKQGNTRLEGTSRTYLARILLAAGDPVAAERQARAAAGVLAVGSPLRAAALSVWASALSRLGRPAEALALAEEAFALLQSAGGSLEEGEALVRLVHFESLAAAGRLAESRAALAAARDRLHARAAAISDPEWRERFLTRVPDNAATLAARPSAE